MIRILLPLAFVTIIASPTLAQPLGRQPSAQPKPEQGPTLSLPGFPQNEKAGSGYLGTKPPVKRGQVIANIVYTVADDFVVDIWQNGEKVADSSRVMLGETFGATDEKINIEVREGDWLVFNVVNNRLRWGGVSYFAVAGMKPGSGVGFVSDVDSRRWSSCDDPSQVNAFIADPHFLSERAVRPSSGKWERGDPRMNELTDGWKGNSIWGHSRNTWIKYVAPNPDATTGIKSGQ